VATFTEQEGHPKEKDNKLRMKWRIYILIHSSITAVDKPTPKTIKVAYQER